MAALIIGLKNYPPEATKWQMAVVDWDVLKDLSWGTLDHNNIEKLAPFDIPYGAPIPEDDWLLPLRINITIDQEWQEADGWHARQLYRFQSIWPDRSDYKDIFIHDYGSYYFNVATEQFEKEVPEPPPEEVPEYKGALSSVELEYDETRADIPAYDIPQNQRGIVLIRGRNDTLEAQRMGVSWIVRDPDGVVVEEYSAWEGWPYTGAGSEHQFIGGRFNLDKIGTYLLSVDLFMNPDAPEVVAQYYGALCTVAAVVPISGIIVDKWVNKAPEGSRLPIPAAVAADGNTFEIGIRGRNTSNQTFIAGMEVTVVDPDGIRRAAPAIDWTGMAPGEELDWEYNISRVDKQGTWILLIRFRTQEVVLNSFEGGCLTVTEALPTYEPIQETIYPWAYTFQGDAETCVFEFTLTPEQIPGTRWIGERIVNSFVSELEKDGSRLLELRVYEDATPTWWTKYRVEVTATASPLAWNVIIIGVLAILFIGAIYFTIKLVDDVFFKRKPLSDETKETFSRATVTSMILDLEPETPPETMAEMSDQELRHLLNQILAEKAPPISWLPFAIVSGILVVGGVSAIALATRRK